MFTLAALLHSIDPHTTGIRLLLATFALVTLWYIRRWWVLEHGRGALSHVRGTDLLVGFGTNFFDTLGIGCFAPTTAIFKMQQRMPDDELPGTLNAGNALPCMAEALIFVAIVTLDITTLVVMIAAAVLGAWLGAGLVARAPRRAIQLGMGVALLISAGLLLAKNLGWMPAVSGDALALHGGVLWFAVAINGLLGALMMVGLGLYAPCLVLVTLLGMDPLAAFPIMMGSCALVMPVGGARFVRARRYSPGAALGLAFGGIPGVLCAAFIVRSLPLGWLRWLVAVVVVYAAVLMLLSARREGRPV
ncbi:MAG: sulfite exporter TauE/SafE family protein [Gammaproteobacteria bacterium]|nr:sulfite exporter TauE/SafE family protein [Gammaproteobacteria bacterium]